MTAKGIRDFIKNQMKMTHIYRPAMLEVTYIEV